MTTSDLGIPGGQIVPSRDTNPEQNTIRETLRQNLSKRILKKTKDPSKRGKVVSDKCQLCKKIYDLNSCQQFRGIDIKDRKKFARKKGFCCGCLGQGHLSKQTKKTKKCDSGRKLHHTSLPLSGDFKENTGNGTNNSHDENVNSPTVNCTKACFMNDVECNRSENALAQIIGDMSRVKKTLRTYEASRGLSARQLICNPWWLSGPELFRKSEISAPCIESLPVSKDDPEVKKHRGKSAIAICLRLRKHLRNYQKDRERSQVKISNQAYKLPDVDELRQGEVTHEQKDDYGKFYNDDSYIILNTYKKPKGDELLYDVHFWIGQNSTQDEYGTAAYKTVELDTLLDDKPVQHREVQGHESSLFKSYFEHITLLEGGYDSGFRHVKPEEYQIRLFHVSGLSRKVFVKEVPPYKSKLDSGDVFIIDNGLEIYQWNGLTCNKDEKFKALQYTQQLKSDRSGKPKVKVLDEVSTPNNHRIYELLQDGDAPNDEDEPDDSDSFNPTLLRLSDEDGSLAMTVVSEGSIPKDQIKSEDVFIADTGKEVFVWIGKHASEGECKNGLAYAHNYLRSSKHPLVSVTVLKEGQESDAFEKILN
ncbi:gelsolin 2 [Paramuricea clavata]|uniref:Gelsolin 2 n=1 Tax=Paramuricea clavata TaxID=317549 RepID=A0A7D9ES77_PARCT|nr:gelsolin 2 [Paramuricea clavata]